ncbi:DUF1507 family protein [Vagococcus vulneris]|uniref:Uncharacterized protein n=1 Tax=Vagococcus vulneris TaxID=1977869 RepID=A0A430A168_9ENTE|nr:DUF1507 family protein [Vagococcus vulneris]RSU00151.1 hypothetical protein CBF37_02300 [Vagococcus vulneris]
MLEISREAGLMVLQEESEKIKRLIKNQHNYECIAQCRAFEEVIDTQMFGYSRQLDFAQKIGIITREENHQLIIKLETELNDVYNKVYDEQRDKEISERK